MGKNLYRFKQGLVKTSFKGFCNKLLVNHDYLFTFKVGSVGVINPEWTYTIFTKFYIIGELLLLL